MTDECITIDSSDEDDVQIMDGSSTVSKTKPESTNDLKRRVPLAKIETGKSIFTELISTCKNADPSSDMDLIVNKMWKRFHQADSSYTSSSTFIEYVKNLMKLASKEPYSQLKLVSDELKCHTVKTKTPVELISPSALSTFSNSSEIDKKTLKKIRKLEKIVVKLQEKITDLENEEIDLNDFSDEEDSAYIKVCRYKNRICDVFKKICELRGTVPSDDCLRGNIKFSGTKITAVNRAIEKFYNERREFPDFRDVLLIVQKANEIKNLRLVPYECQEIAVSAFKELGETLKRRRQFEFHDGLISYLGDNICDPALESPHLREKLEENTKLYGNRIDEIIDKFAKKQTEENLEAEDVPDDSASEVDEIEDDAAEDEEDVSSVVEIESNDGSTSVNEDHTRCILEVDDANEVDDDDDEELPFQARNFKVVLPDLHQTPEWLQYQSAQRRVHSATAAAAICQPIPGCSKDIIDDFCLSCSNKELSRSATKRLHNISADSSNDDDEAGASCSKMAKYGCSAPMISVDLTGESQVVEHSNGKTESPEGVAKLATQSAAADLVRNKETVCASSGEVCDRTPKNSATKASSQFVLVDVNSILSKVVPKGGRNGESIAPKDSSKSVHKPPWKTEVISHDSSSGKRDTQVPSSKACPDALCVNGIKIVNVLSKKPVSNEQKARAVEKGTESSNHVKDGAVAADKNDKSNSEIIDLEEVPDKNKVNSKKVPRLVENKEPKKSSDSSSSTHLNNSKTSVPYSRLNSYHDAKKGEDNCPPWQKHSLAKNKFFATSTPKSNVSHSFRPNSRPFSAQSRAPQFRPPRTANFDGNRSNAAHLSQYPPRPRAPFFVPNRRAPSGDANRPGVTVGPRTAVAKRTMQTTQKFVKGNNIYTQTMTVVQESVLQLPAGASANGAQTPFRNNFTGNTAPNSYSSNNNNNNNVTGNRGGSNGIGANGANDFRFGARAADASSRNTAQNYFAFGKRRFESSKDRKSSTQDVITLD